MFRITVIRFTAFDSLPLTNNSISGTVLPPLSRFTDPLRGIDPSFAAIYARKFGFTLRLLRYGTLGIHLSANDTFTGQYGKVR